VFLQGVSDAASRRPLPSLPAGWYESSILLFGLHVCIVPCVLNVRTIPGVCDMISHGLISVVGTLTLPPCVTGLCSEQTLQVQDKVTCTVALQTTFCR
jgi:hypothetical protein